MNIEHIGDVTTDERARLERAKQFIMGYPDYAKCISAVETFAVRYFADEEEFTEEFRAITGKEPSSGQKGCITTECGRVVMLLLRSHYIERTFFHECVHHAANVFPALRSALVENHSVAIARLKDELRIRIGDCDELSRDSYPNPQDWIMEIVADSEAAAIEIDLRNEQQGTAKN